MSLKKWLKNLIAGAELSELEKWRGTWEEHRRWLADFPQIATALDSLREMAEGKSNCKLDCLRGDLKAQVRVGDFFRVDTEDGKLGWITGLATNLQGETVYLCRMANKSAIDRMIHPKLIRKVDTW